MFIVVTVLLAEAAATARRLRRDKPTRSAGKSKKEPD
jgi:hypothetical protein